MIEPTDVEISLENTHVFQDDMSVLTLRIPVPNELIRREENHHILIEVVTAALQVVLGHAT